MNRKELKAKGQICFKRNYWRSVLVSMIISIITGGLIIVITPMNEIKTFVRSINTGEYSITSVFGDSSTIDDYNKIEKQNDELVDYVNAKKRTQDKNVEIYSSTKIATLLFLTIYLFALLIVIAIKVFVFNPLYAGGNSFFLKNLNNKEKIYTIFAMFKRNMFKKTVKVILLKNIFVFLWTLLLIVPGIIKYYEYRMIPFIIVDKPNIELEEVFQQSKKMMYGNKFEVFIFDLSFIGWWILSLLTFGFLNFLYVNPYKRQMDAVLYEWIMEKNNKKTDYDNYFEVSTNNNKT